MTNNQFEHPGISIFHIILAALDPRRVEHDPDASTHGLGWEVLAKLSTNSAAVAVRPGDLAPHDADAARLLVARARSLVARLVHVRAALAQVELRLGLGRDAVDAQQRRVLVLVAQAALEASEYSLDVETSGLLGGYSR